ncbi:DUF3887 domain-containing protein [Rhodanobacter sp. AS-Z3]|uniref:DUF3887 domain-containing protein n=1 Tax=Rhodanobacter sp. AS-Z3 TaxID=3031330 RepID=UPI0024788316|nr:DUF3887 domain-containing protein [Rhodanobacter sp. AS-Z3]WEN14426.1 DUF3887 domain-containing protein [Rhodanobacter sp. AS-Z3]
MLKLAASLCIVYGLGIGVAQAAAPSCEATSSKMLAQLDKGDYSGATADFNEQMKSALDADRLNKIWTAIAQQFGARGAHDPARVSEVKGHTVVITPLHYGTHRVDARVVCDPDGKVAGFFIKPLD